MVARSKLLTPATLLADRRPFPRLWLPHVASRHAASAAVTRRLADKAVIARRRTVTHHARCAPCHAIAPCRHHWERERQWLYPVHHLGPTLSLTVQKKKDGYEKE
jgi:hypothetical protein